MQGKPESLNLTANTFNCIANKYLGADVQWTRSNPMAGQLTKTAEMKASQLEILENLATQGRSGEHLQCSLNGKPSFSLGGCGL